MAQRKMSDVKGDGGGDGLTVGKEFRQTKSGEAPVGKGTEKDMLSAAPSDGTGVTGAVERERAKRREDQVTP